MILIRVVEGVLLCFGFSVRNWKSRMKVVFLLAAFLSIYFTENKSEFVNYQDFDDFYNAEGEHSTDQPIKTSNASIKTNLSTSEIRPDSNPTTPTSQRSEGSTKASEKPGVDGQRNNNEHLYAAGQHRRSTSEFAPTSKLN